MTNLPIKNIIKSKYVSGFSKSCSAFLMSALLAVPAAQAFTPGGNNGGDPGCNADCSLGIDPTDEMLEAEKGPYSIEHIDIPSNVDGFKGGRIHYPVGFTQKLGLIIIGPGFLYADEASSRWLGPRLASNGFVTVNINFNSVIDFPDLRSQQYDVALDYVIALSKDPASPLFGRVDENRLGAAGWSMGGGGAIDLATKRPLKAIMPWAPWYFVADDFAETMKTPTLIIACQGDVVAPINIHASPLYDAVPNTVPKAYVKYNGGNHWCSNNGSRFKDTIGKLGISWFKFFMDGDTRYEQYLCDADIENNPGVVELRDNCGAW